MGLIVAITAALAAAQDPPIDARIELEPAIIPFHQQATLTLVVSAPQDMTLDLPDLSRHFDTLMTADMPVREIRSLGRGREEVRLSITIEAVRSALYPIDPITIAYGDGQTLTLPVPALRVRELTPEEELAAEQFVGIAGPMGVPSMTSPRRWLAWAAVLCAVLAAVLWWRSRRRRGPPPAPVMTPWERAYARLRALDERRLPEQGGYDAYYVELSAILREYIEDRYHIHAPEQTSQEFLAEASTSGEFSKEHEGLLARFLRHCDRVKFARYEPSVQEMEQSMADVLAFIDETIPSAAPAEEAAA